MGRRYETERAKRSRHCGERRQSFLHGFLPRLGPHQLSAPSPGLSDLKRLDSRLRTAVFASSGQITAFSGQSVDAPFRRATAT
jgi:hypothetical protein